MTESPHSKPDHTYVIDPESATEMARLIVQDRMITEGMRGIFPERSNLDNIQALLDVGCGPGGWALDVAHTYPEKTVIGIDISPTMVTYAQAQATAQRLNNVTFLVMNALQPFDFPDATFDLVNVRAATGFIPRTQWTTFLQHCVQVLRPSGTLRLTEADMIGLTNSPACEKICSWAVQMLHDKGYGFYHDGSHLGVFPMLGLLLQETGCVNIQHMSHMYDYSIGTVLYTSQYQNYMVWPLLMQRALVHNGITTEQEFDITYKTMLQEMHFPRFRGLGSLLTVWGEKRA